MRKCYTFIFIFILLLPGMLKAGVPQEVFSDFTSSWLFQYSPADYELEIHPYTLNDVSLGDVNVLWDLNTDGIVNSSDLNILNNLDMTKMINDMDILKQTPLTSEGLESLALGIYLQEITHGISHFKLFKILLWQSGFDVVIYEYQAGAYIHAKIMWVDGPEKGWVNIVWQNDGLFKFKYTFEYLKEANPQFNSLVGNWCFNETSGTTAPDTSDFANQGSLINGTGWTENGELRFDGVDDYVAVADSSSLDIQDELTISLWIYMDEYSTDWPKLVIKPYDLANTDPWELFTIDLGHYGTYPRFILTDGLAEGKSAYAYDSSHTLSLSQWHHIAGTYDGSTTSLYIDGVKVNSMSKTIQIGTNDLPLCIGGRLGDHCFNGLIDNLCIYNRGLTESEIMDLYDKHNNRPGAKIKNANIKRLNPLKKTQ